MKADKYESCGDCGKWEYAYPGCGEQYCYKLHGPISNLDIIHPNCPLRDWPSVSMEQVNALIYELATKTIYVEWGKDIYGKDTARADLRIRPAQEIIAKFCDSISVEKEK